MTLHETRYVYPDYARKERAMTKHDDDLSERAARLNDPEAPPVIPLDDLVVRFRALEEENAGLLLELNRARELISYYRNLSGERFGFVATPPPGTMFHDED